MLNVKIWANALRTIPRISKEEWENYDIISRWLIASRSAVFILTALSAGVGGLIAFRDGQFILLNFIVATAGLVFAHASNNLINDLVDFNKGIDKDNYYRAKYGPQALEHELLTKPVFLRYVFVSLLLAVICGFYLVLQTGPLTMYLALAGLFFLLFYTWPLKYIGLGEPTVLIVWGPLMIGGTYYVTTGGTWSWEAVVIGLVYAIGPTSVLFGKHTDKLPEDKVKNVRTLPVIMGEKAARITNISLWIIQYILIFVFVGIQVISPAILITLLAIPKLIVAIKRYIKPRPKEAPADFPPNEWPLYLASQAFIYNRRFGGLFLLGLILNIVITRLGLF